MTGNQQRFLARAVSGPLHGPLRHFTPTAAAHIAIRALREEGWLRSYRLQRPVNNDGEPLPWYSYAAIHFLSHRLEKGMRVFDFGAGHSTLWYAQRVDEVVSVEDDAVWCQELSARLPANVSLVYQSDPQSYVEEVAQHGSFEVIVIDGQHRPESASAALDALTGDGVLIWDNSDWDDFRRTYPAVIEPRGFRELEFRSLGPINPYVFSTSVLYRPANCLGI